MKRFLAWLLGRRLIVLFDFDGSENVRLERISPTGRSYCHRYGEATKIYLKPGGRTQGRAYVEGWACLADYRRNLTPGQEALNDMGNVIPFREGGRKA